MALTYALFFFVAFGAKVVLAAATIYLIFPSERECPQCDCETLPVRMGALGRGVSRLMLGTLQRRWCPRCGWEGTTRTARPSRRAQPSGAAGSLDFRPSTRTDR